MRREIKFRAWDKINKIFRYFNIESETEDLEIIGNIFENPEILNKGEENGN